MRLYPSKSVSIVSSVSKYKIFWITKTIIKVKKFSKTTVKNVHHKHLFIFSGSTFFKALLKLSSETQIGIKEMRLRVNRKPVR